MKEKFKAWLASRRSTDFPFFLLAGGALLYYAYSLFKDLGTVTDDRVPLILFAVLFLLVGGCIFAIGAYGTYKNYKATGEAQEQDDENGEN